MATEKGSSFNEISVQTALAEFERRVALTEAIPAIVTVEDVHIYRQTDDRYALEYEFEFQFKREEL